MPAAYSQNESPARGRRGQGWVTHKKDNEPPRMINLGVVQVLIFIFYNEVN
jgi:hypothetical protein